MDYVPGYLASRVSGDEHSSYLRLTEGQEADEVMKVLRDRGSFTEYCTYEKEKKAFDDTGIPTSAWKFYFYVPTFFLIVLLFTAVAARLYTGCGYWHSLALTLEERHAATYFGGLLKSVEVSWLDVVSFTNYIT